MKKSLVLIILCFFFASAQAVERTFVVKRGDTLSRYFKTLGLSDGLMIRILNARSEHRALNNLKPGQEVGFTFNDRNALVGIRYKISNRKTIKISLTGQTFAKERTTGFVKQKLDRQDVVINSSLFRDGKRAGLSNATLNVIAREFSAEIDFSKDLKKGDRFIIIDPKKRYPSAIIYQSGKKNLSIFSHRDKHGRTNYFNQNGQSLRQSFLKAPLKYKRISSPYQLRRFHPILKVWLPHRAIDYAAPTGTPVYAASGGYIKQRKRLGALGKTIFIQHRDGYETVYAHLSRYAKGIRVGQRVSKGSVIGYVGSTGRSTGPHLHYELRHHGVRKNPATYRPSFRTSIANSERSKFRQRAGNILFNLGMV